MTQDRTPAQAIAQEIDKLDGLVARARNDLALGGIMDLKPLESRVQAICVTIQDLDGEDGRRIMPRLTALLDELAAFGQEIEQGRHALASELGESDRRQSAANAYVANSNVAGPKPGGR